MRKLSRMEANKEVRRILNRHKADLSYAQYSVAGMDIRLTGWLCKCDTSDFNAAQIEIMIHEFQRVLPGYSISGDFENWHFSSDHITCLDSAVQGGSQEEEVIVYEIDYDDDAEAS